MRRPRRTGRLDRARTYARSDVAAGCGCGCGGDRRADLRRPCRASRHTAERFGARLLTEITHGNSQRAATSGPPTRPAKARAFTPARLVNVTRRYVGAGPVASLAGQEPPADGSLLLLFFFLFPHLLVRLLTARSRCWPCTLRRDVRCSTALCCVVLCSVLSCRAVAVQRRRTPPLAMSHSGTGRDGNRVSIRPPPWRRAAAADRSRRCLRRARCVIFDAQ